LALYWRSSWVSARSCWRSGRTSARLIAPLCKAGIDPQAKLVDPRGQVAVGAHPVLTVRVLPIRVLAVAVLIAAVRILRRGGAPAASAVAAAMLIKIVFMSFTPSRPRACVD
jgi:hypothetical protein